MIDFFKGLFGGDSAASKKPAEASAVEYDGFSISPCPRDVGGGWTTEGVIRKQLDGETKAHAFIRADTSPSREAAISLVVHKAKTLIDQRGDKIFS